MTTFSRLLIAASTALVATLCTASLFACSKSGAAEATKATTANDPSANIRSSDWLAALPEGDTKRQVILGCTPCHQLGPPVAFKKTLVEWRTTIARMKKIDDDLDLQLISLKTEELAQWFVTNAKMPKAPFEPPKAMMGKAEYKEFPAGVDTGFYHDMTVADGRAWIGDYFGNKLYGINVETGAVETFDIPVEVPKGKPGGAHQIDVTKDGTLWLTFTKSNQVMRFDTKSGKFKVFNGFEAGSSVQYFVVDLDRNIYQDEGGGIWVTHFSREILSRLDPKTGKVDVFQTPRTGGGLAENAVHLYAAVADSTGKLWYTETHGNKLGVLDPKTREASEIEMGEKFVGPKRLAIDEQDRLWIPELATGRIQIYDTKTRKFVETLKLPIPGDFPYGVRRNRFTGDMWVTGSGSDSLYRVDSKTKKFEIFRLPHRGTYTRTISFTPDGYIWTCYASFPNQHTQSPHNSGVVLRIKPL